jgi:hypothetical protein
MSLPSSGALSFSAIANDLPLYAPYGGRYGSLDKMTLITGVGGSFDGSGNFSRDAPYNTSAFYGWGGGGFKFGNVKLIHDYALNGHYASPSNVITDTSGFLRNGVFVTGTGNGTPANVTGYNSSIGYINSETSNQRSVRLDDYAKFAGTQPHTIICWFNVSTFTSSYPGIIACEGRSSSTGQPIGYTLYLNQINAIHYGINYSRFSGTSGTQFNLQLIPIGQQFTVGFWYMVAAVFDGSTASLIMYQATSPTQITGQSASNNYSIATESAWSCFQGLRYNNWLDGSFGYTALYDYALTAIDIKKIQGATRLRYI